MMCWKKKPPIINCTRQLLSFAINNYQGTSNDLNGCINDQDDLIDALPGAWAINTFRDHEATIRAFRDNIKNYVLGMRAGDYLIIQYSGHGTRVKDSTGDEADGYDEALYLYDGTFSDDEFNELMLLIPAGAKVMVALDSCFSGTATRKTTYFKPKYMPPKETTKTWAHNRIVKSSGLNHIVFSGCRSDQTSADALINNRYNGAFTYFWLKAMDTRKTYREWIVDTAQGLLINEFEQVPTLEGPEDMLNQLIFT